MRTFFEVIELDTASGTDIIDITPRIKAIIEKSGIDNGLTFIGSRHTTTAITINEYEIRLLEDIRRFVAHLAPQQAEYLHNDIHLRDCPLDEPRNAHSHLQAMLLGNSESLPLVKGQLMLGTYQSVMLVELDGPRHRGVNVQIIGE